MSPAEADRWNHPLARAARCWGSAADCQAIADDLAALLERRELGHPPFTEAMRLRRDARRAEAAEFRRFAEAWERAHDRGVTFRAALRRPRPRRRR